MMHNTTYYIMKEQGSAYKISPCILLDAQSASIISNPIRAKIIEILSKKPMHPSELAAYMKMHEQKIYYHIKQLSNAGIIEIVEKQEIKGTVAKKYKPRSTNFAINLYENWQNFRPEKTERESELKILFKPFIRENKLDTYIVVGSPDPHGQFKSHARDGHYAIDLGILLGNICSLSEKFPVKLDVDIKMEKEEKNNLIIIGGPGTNMLAYEINEYLPVKFDIKVAEEGFYCSGLVSTKSGRKISDETTGVIEIIRNPFDKGKHILLVAGYRFIGTKAAVIALTRFYNQIMQKFKSYENSYAIVKGFDFDGDGKIDSIEIIE